MPGTTVRLRGEANVDLLIARSSRWEVRGTIGNVDDDGHRELCAAEAGSPARLLLTRSATAFVSVVAAALTTAGAAMVGRFAR